jgi:hypothetical protein
MPLKGNEYPSSSMAKRKRSTTGWGACKKVVSSWPTPGVVALLRELYELNAENKIFLQARLLPSEGTAVALDAAKRKVRTLVNTVRIMNGHFSHAEVKRVVDQFEKASADPHAVAELLLEDLNVASKAFAEIGDDLAVVNHIYSMLSRLDKTLHRVPGERLAPLIREFEALAQRYQDRFGYGISDEFVAAAEFWADKIGQRPNDSTDGEGAPANAPADP